MMQIKDKRVCFIVSSKSDMLTINAYSDTNTLIIRVGQIQNVLSIHILCNYPYLFEIYNQEVQFLDSSNYSSNLTGLKMMLTIRCNTHWLEIGITCSVILRSIQIT